MDISKRSQHYRSVATPSNVCQRGFFFVKNMQLLYFLILKKRKQTLGDLYDADLRGDFHCFLPVFWTTGNSTLELVALTLNDLTRKYRVDHKFWHIFLYAVITLNFSNFFHCLHQEKICNNTLLYEKLSLKIIPQMSRSKADTLNILI